MTFVRVDGAPQWVQRLYHWTRQRHCRRRGHQPRRFGRNMSTGLPATACDHCGLILTFGLDQP